MPILKQLTSRLVQVELFQDLCLFLILPAEWQVRTLILYETGEPIVQRAIYSGLCPAIATCKWAYLFVLGKE